MMSRQGLMGDQIKDFREFRCFLKGNVGQAFLFQLVGPKP